MHQRGGGGGDPINMNFSYCLSCSNKNDRPYRVYIWLIWTNIISASPLSISIPQCQISPISVKKLQRWFMQIDMGAPYYALIQYALCKETAENKLLALHPITWWLGTDQFPTSQALDNVHYTKAQDLQTYFTEFIFKIGVFSWTNSRRCRGTTTAAIGVYVWRMFHWNRLTFLSGPLPFHSTNFFIFPHLPYTQPLTKCTCNGRINF
jgi:hypothetical protein